MNCSFVHLGKCITSQQNYYMKLTIEKPEHLIKQQTWVVDHLQFLMPFIHRVRTLTKTAKDGNTSTENNTGTDGDGDPRGVICGQQKKKKHPVKEGPKLKHAKLGQTDAEGLSTDKRKQ